MSYTPKIIAHRGDSGNNPENSLDAIFAGFNSGADLVEVDLQLTKDNKVVLFHDGSINRIFPTLRNGENKSIVDFAWSQLKDMDAGSWFDKSFAHVRVPLFENVIIKTKDITSKGLGFIFEIKRGNLDQIIPTMLDILDRHTFKFNGGYISVRDTITYERIGDYNSKYPVGLMQKKRSPKELLHILFEYNIEITQIRPQLWKEDDWDSLQKSKRKFTIFYADTPAEYEFFLTKHPYGILTNYPKRLMSFLTNKR